MLRCAFALFIALFAANAFAGFTANCELRGKATLWTMMVEEIGTPSEKMPLHPTSMVVLGPKGGLIFQEETSGAQLEQVKPEVLFELFEKNVYPIKDPSKVLNPDPEKVRLRRLAVKLSFEKGKYKSIAFSAEQSISPFDGRFLGDAVLIDEAGKESKTVADCYLYIDWGKYRSMAERAKKQ